jgi:hypothetical protein
MAVASVNSIGPLPLGVALLAVLIGIVGFIFLVVSVLVLLFVSAGALSGFAIYGVGLIGGLVLLIISLIVLAVAYGLWNQELWALVLSIIVVGFLWLSDVLTGRLLSIGGLVLLVLLIYLVAVHRHFI